ncbi:MAG TPA: LacI family DNA-binding transcriptional regulator, partial [Actinotalea sp.]|nr:LacI family DNA-binding transcriptional regulator [Actinotalea sp.]
MLSKRFDNDIHRGVPSRSGREGTVHMATIGDVAKEAGVSISTVSYALSGKRAITEETRVKVLDAARRLGYAPQAAARALAARRSDLLAVTTPLHADTDHSAHMAFAMAVTRAARARDYDTVLLVHDDALEGMRRSAATSLADGIVVLDVAADDARAELARTLDCPVVFIGLPSDTAGLTC